MVSAIIASNLLFLFLNIKNLNKKSDIFLKKHCPESRKIHYDIRNGF